MYFGKRVLRLISLSPSSSVLLDKPPPSPQSEYSLWLAHFNISCHTATKWVSFDDTQIRFWNSIYRERRFSVKWNMFLLVIVLYYTSSKLRKSSKIAEKLHLYQYYETFIYHWLNVSDNDLPLKSYISWFHSETMSWNCMNCKHGLTL